MVAERLAPVVGYGATGEDNPEEFAKWRALQAEEINHLVKAPCGVELLYLIGWVYANRSRQFFAGWMIKRVIAKVEGKVHLAQSKANLYKEVGKTCLRVNKIVKST